MRGILNRFRSPFFSKHCPLFYNSCHSSSSFTSLQYFDLNHIQSSSSNITPKFSLSDFILFPNHFTLQEQTFLTTHSLKKLKRVFGKKLVYQPSHFDHIIHNYRECQVTNWTSGDNEIEQEVNNLLVNKVYNLFSKEINWLPIHILELAESVGGIKPHIDNIEYSGNLVAGICLISPTVMILRHVNNPECEFSVLLEPGCLYVQRDTIRYNFTHEIPVDPEQHKFKNNLIPKGRRISLMFRSQELELPENEISTVQTSVDNNDSLNTFFRADKQSISKPFIPPSELILNNLNDILPSTLMVERVFFSTCEKPILYKRHLSDVKFQMAQEDNFLETSDINTKILTLTADNDIVQGVYEGGMKTWECALDLVEFLSKNTDNLHFEGKKVLELGCGSSLPGIYVLTTKNPLRVDFQDYNEQVLKLVTIPNILLNSLCPKTEVDFSDGVAMMDVPEYANLLDQLKKSRFFMGDWSGLTKIMNLNIEQEKYDLILTSETIYNTDSLSKLYNVIKHSLKRPSGIALIAAKSIYFGVGGGILPFCQLVEQDKVFEIKNFYNVEAHVKREILMLTFLDSFHKK